MSADLVPMVLCEAKMKPLEQDIAQIREDMGYMRTDLHEIHDKIGESLALKATVEKHDKFIETVKKWSVLSLIILILLLVGLNLPQILAVVK